MKLPEKSLREVEADVAQKDERIEQTEKEEAKRKEEQARFEELKSKDTHIDDESTIHFYK